MVHVSHSNCEAVFVQTVERRRVDHHFTAKSLSSVIGNVENADMDLSEFRMVTWILWMEPLLVRFVVEWMTKMV